MAFYGLLLCGFHVNCTQYVWKPAASNAPDKLNRVQHQISSAPVLAYDLAIRRALSFDAVMPRSQAG
jgi:hypothetical protein